MTSENFFVGEIKAAFQGNARKLRMLRRPCIKDCGRTLPPLRSNFQHSFERKVQYRTGVR